jgi:hypothetical protein
MRGFGPGDAGNLPSPRAGPDTGKPTTTRPVRLPPDHGRSALTGEWTSPSLCRFLAGPLARVLRRVMRATRPPTGLRQSKAQAYWSAHQALYETSVRRPMAALFDELGGEFGPGRIAGPYRDVRFRAGKPPCKTAACRASCGRVDGRLGVHDRRPVDRLQRVEFNPEPVARPDAGPVQADGVRPIGRAGAEHAGQRPAQVVLGMRAQLVAGRQVQSAEHHDLVARPQVLGTLRDLLIEADPRPGRAVALVRRIVEDPQGRLHPPDRHQAVARLHTNSLLAGRGHGPQGCKDRPIRPARVGVTGSPKPRRSMAWRVWNRPAVRRGSGAL